MLTDLCLNCHFDAIHCDNLRSGQTFPVCPFWPLLFQRFKVPLKVWMTRDTEGYYGGGFHRTHYCVALASEESEFPLGSMKENLRTHFLLKKRAKLSVDMNCSSKIHVD